MAKVYIGLGTNLGNRHDNLQQVKNLIRQEGIDIVKESSILETEPVDYLEQPKFLNQIIMAETEKAPMSLLFIMQKIEKTMGKKISIPKGPRIIDLDILLYNNIVFKNKNLSIPHGGIRKREFILRHLLELDKELKDPETGIKYMEAWREYNKKHQ